MYSSMLIEYICERLHLQYHCEDSYSNDSGGVIVIARCCFAEGLFEKPNGESKKQDSVLKP